MDRNREPDGQLGPKLPNDPKPSNDCGTERDGDSLADPVEQPVALRTRRRAKLNDQSEHAHRVPEKANETTPVPHKTTPVPEKTTPVPDSPSEENPKWETENESETLRLRFKALEAKDDDFAPGVAIDVGQWLLEEGSPVRRRIMHKESSSDGDSEDSQIRLEGRNALMRKHGFESTWTIRRRLVNRVMSLPIGSKYALKEGYEDQTYPFQRNNSIHEQTKDLSKAESALTGTSVPPEPFQLKHGRFKGGASHVVSRYIIGRKIGQGSEGKVYHAADAVHQKEAAVKISKTCNASPEPGLFEPVLLKSLHHRRILDVLYFAQEEGRIFVVMEYLPGGDMYRFLKARKRMSEEECRVLFRQVVEALIYLKRMRIAHRDLSLKNLLIDGAGANIKLADFGVSQVECQPGTRFTKRCGTKNYWAPELHRKGSYDPFKSDIWSAGVIFYHMIAFHTSYWTYHKPYYLAVGRGKAKVLETPYYVSPEMTNFLRRLVYVQETWRATIEEVAQHKWLNAGCFMWPYKPVMQVTQEMMKANEKAREQIRKSLDKHDFDYGPEI